MDAAPDDPPLESLRVLIAELEPGDVTGERVRLRVPVAGYLRRVPLVEHRIEDRLLGQARGEGAQPRLVYELQLLEADGPEQNHLSG